MKILILQVNSEIDGNPSVTSDGAKIILQGEVQTFWNWHFPVDYSDVTTGVVNISQAIQMIATHQWVKGTIIQPWLQANGYTQDPNDYTAFDFYITLLPPKAYGWVGLTAELGYILISTSDPTKYPLIMAHEMGHSLYELGHSNRQFYSLPHVAQCAYEPFKDRGGDDLMGGVLHTLNPYHMNTLGVENPNPSAATLYWLSPVDENKSSVQFAPGYWVYHRLTNKRFHVLHNNLRQYHSVLFLDDVFYSANNVEYVTDNGFHIVHGGWVETYLNNGITSLYGFDLTTLNPKSVPVFIREIVNPCP